MRASFLGHAKLLSVIEALFLEDIVMHAQSNKIGLNIMNHVKYLVARERAVQAELIKALIVIDQDRLFLPEYTSMFSYLTKELGYSDASA
jgi:hypothetical protein